MHLKSYRFNILFFRIAIVLCFSALVYRLYDLQVVKGDIYKERAINNKEQVVRIPAYRGEIFTGEDEVKIAENLPSYSLYLIPKPFYDLRRKTIAFNEKLNLIETRFDLPRERILKILDRRKLNPFSPVLIKSDIAEEKVFYLAENKEKFPELLFISDLKRRYFYGENFAHITGYIQKINSREYNQKKDQGYFIDSIVGRQGVESYYDKELRGRVGFKIQTVDVKKRVKKEIEHEDNNPIPGNNLYLTTETKVQNILAKVMKHYPGGAIVTRASTGEVLGLYSSPSYDPNIFSGEPKKEEFKKLIEDENNPFLNRVIQGEYPPSSIFKLIVALTALDNSQVNFNSLNYYCRGGLRIGGQYFKCTGYHANQDFISAIANSCNVFFYKLGILIGPNSIHRGAETFFNLGQKQLIDLSFEKAGRIPSQKWKLERIGNFWWDGDTANFSIGQGFSLVSILQVNTVTAAIANDGIAYRPHLVKKFYDLKNAQEVEIKKEVLFTLPFSKLNLKRVQNAMRQVVRWGTAKRIDNDRIVIAGKTGTAEIYKKQDTHAWFTGYAPYDGEDKLVVTVLIENGGFGGVLASTFARAILDGIFLDRDPFLTIKEILQPWESQSDIYETWLTRNDQKKLPASYFK